jgi:hypothetical protein
VEVGWKRCKCLGEQSVTEILVAFDGSFHSIHSQLSMTPTYNFELRPGCI